MTNKSDLSKCLSELLSILNISGRALARGINVDPSVISRWKTGKRQLPYESNYLELISIFLSNNVVTALQQKKITDIILKYNIQVDIENSLNMNECIYNILLETQKNSIPENYNNVYTENKTKYDELKSNYTIKTNTKKTSIFKSEFNKSNKNNQACHIQQNTHGKYGTLTNVEIITDKIRIKQACIELLKSALDKSCDIDEPIFLTSLTEKNPFFNSQESNLQWNKVLHEVLKKGWNITKLIRLSDNINNNLKIVNEIKMHFSTGRYHPYYLKKYNYFDFARDFIIVPKAGALIYINSPNSNTLDNALLIKDKQALEIFKGSFLHIINQSSPLINSYHPIKCLDAFDKITESDELNGNRYTFKFGLNVLTIPLNLYERYLMSEKEVFTVSEISKRISLHKRRLEAFHKQCENFKYYDICSKKAIENLVKKCEYDLNKVTPSEICEHLQNVIYLLRKYDNYEIALLNDIQSNNSIDISWTVKDSSTVLLQNLCKNKNHIKNTSNKNELDTAKCISISEPIIVNAFKNHFMDLWEEIPLICKEKNSVIKWLEDQIKSISEPR